MKKPWFLNAHFIQKKFAVFFDTLFWCEKNVKLLILNCLLFAFFSDENAIFELEKKIERGELSDLAAYHYPEVRAA